MASEELNADQFFNEEGSHIDIHILVVDDDVTTLAIVGAMLKACRYGVFTVENPHDALDTLRKKKGLINLVVTDLHMPQMNGFQLQKNIQEEFQLPVIMMSADNRKSTVEKSLESGSALFIEKPVCPDDVKNLWQYAAITKKDKPTPLVEELDVSCNEVVSKLVEIEKVSSDIDDENGVNSDHDQSYSSSSKSEEEKNENEKNCKRKASQVIKDDQCYGNPMAPKKSKIVWTNSLHNRFLMAVRHLGLDKAVPKRILEFMNVPGLTRENVASHLQKYRIFLKRVAEKGTVEGLSDRALRSSFASGLSSVLLRNLQKKGPLLPHQQHIRSILQSQAQTTNVLSAYNNNQYPPQSHFHEHLEDPIRKPVSQLQYGQSYNASYNGFSNLQTQGSLESSSLINEFRFGFRQSNSWTASQVNNIFQQPRMNYANTPLYQANYQYNNRIRRTSSGYLGYGIMNSSNGHLGSGNTMHRYSQQIQPNLQPSRAYQVNYNYGTSRGSTFNSSPVTGIQGVVLSNEVNNNVHGSASGTQDGNMNVAAVPVMGMEGGTSNYVVQGGPSSTWLPSENQYTPALTHVNVQENMTRLLELPIQQNGHSNDGGEHDCANNYPLSITNAPASNNSSLEDLLEDIDLFELFLLLDQNQPPCEQQDAEDHVQNPVSSATSNQTEALNPTVVELLDAGSSNSSVVQESPGQPQGIINVIKPATESTMDLHNEFQPSFDQIPDQPQDAQDLLTSESVDMCYIENSSSGDNLSLDQDFDMEFLEAFFSNEPDASAKLEDCLEN